MRPSDEGLLVRYWAGAKAAAGTAQEYVPVTEGMTVGAVVVAIEETHPRLRPVLEVASLLLDGRAAGRDDPVGAAASLEVLPPFAGG